MFESLVNLSRFQTVHWTSQEGVQVDASSEGALSMLSLTISQSPALSLCLHRSLSIEGTAIHAIHYNFSARTISPGLCASIVIRSGKDTFRSPSVPLFSDGIWHNYIHNGAHTVDFQNIDKEAQLSHFQFHEGMPGLTIGLMVSRLDPSPSPSAARVDFSYVRLVSESGIL